MVVDTYNNSRQPDSPDALGTANGFLLHGNKHRRSIYFLGGQIGLNQLILSIKSSITSFTIMPLILFILMGSVLFLSGIATNMINALNKLVGRLPGRLSLLAVVAGTLFATLSGSSTASTALLGSSLVPEMEKHGYKKSMTMGPILGSGGLATMIPPSGLAVFLAVIAEVSVGKLLIAIIIPGLLLAFVYAAYVLIRCGLQPSLAPPYEVGTFTASEKAVDFFKYILPLALIVFLVTGLIFMGIATPSESAAIGCLGAFILAAAYGQFKWSIIKKSLHGTVRTSVMILIIMASATAFSQVLSFSGASNGVVEFVVNLPIPGIAAIIGIQIIILILGCFMHVAGIIMISIPLFMPIVNTIGYDPIWFVVITLLNIELAGITPPFGLSLFVMKGVSPSGTKISEIYQAANPFIGLQLLVMAILIAAPPVSLWLPSVMK